MDVDVVQEVITYTVKVYVTEDMRETIQWGLGHTDGSQAGRDAVARWIRQTLDTGMNNLRRARYARLPMIKESQVTIGH